MVGGPTPCAELDFFVRGDVDADGTLNFLPDTLFLLEFGFTMGAPPRCMDTADVDDDGALNFLVDALYLLNFGFLDGEAPPPPSVACGSDPTPDMLECDSYPFCP